MMKSPLETVAKKFKDKDALVEAVKKLATDALWLGRVSEGKGLDCVSNAKLLRLHSVLTQVKEKFGSRDALIDEMRKLEKRVKDDGFRSRLMNFPTPRLWDMYGAAAKRARAASSKAG